VEKKEERTDSIGARIVEQKREEVIVSRIWIDHLFASEAEALDKRCERSV
jgi:hypothetical protein